MAPIRERVAMEDRPGLRTGRHGRVVRVALDVPERRNAISRVLADGFAAILDDASADETVGAVVVTGSGNLFCAGGDFADMSDRGLAGWREHFEGMARLTRRLVAFPKPTVAAVEGWAIGGGLALACCCDRVVAGAGARFVYGFDGMAVLPDVGLMKMLVDRVGKGSARRIAMWGERFDAEAALAEGLADRVVPAGEALKASMEEAERVAAAAPLPVAWLKSFAAAGLERALAFEKDCASVLFTSADHAEGRAAFGMRRPPVFTGH